jgi:dihydropteroate synthase
VPVGWRGLGAPGLSLPRRRGLTLTRCLRLTLARGRRLRLTRRAAAGRPAWPRDLEVSQLLAERGNLDVAIGHGLRDRVQRLVGSPLVVSPHRGGRTQQRYVGRRLNVRIEWPDISGELRHLPAAPHGDHGHPCDDGGRHQNQYRKHMKNRAMLGPVTAHSDWPEAGFPGWPDPDPRRVPGLWAQAGSRPTALLAIVASLSEARSALAAGADMADLGAAGPDTIRAAAAQLAGAVVCAAGPPAHIVRDVAAARETGAVALCQGIDAARGSGLPASRVLVEVPPWLIPEVSGAGWAAVVDADRGAILAARQTAYEWPDGCDPGDDHDDSGVLAIAALSSWLGAAVVRTRHAAAARRALDMTASIRGLRPPARAIRGLA